MILCEKKQQQQQRPVLAAAAASPCVSDHFSQKPNVLRPLMTGPSHAACQRRVGL